MLHTLIDEDSKRVNRRKTGTQYNPKHRQTDRQKQQQSAMHTRKPHTQTIPIANKANVKLSDCIQVTTKKKDQSRTKQHKYPVHPTYEQLQQITNTKKQYNNTNIAKPKHKKNKRNKRDETVIRISKPS